MGAIELEENIPFVKPGDGQAKSFPEGLSLKWRLIHNTLYLIGGIGFVSGSHQYFSTVTNLNLGGWLFTIGSMGFLIADLMEWWKNNHVGCVGYGAYEISYEKEVSTHFEPKETLRGCLQRAELGLNFFCSFIGSTLYLIGSIYYIPAVNLSPQGDLLFIVGSAIIFFAQSWKLYRTGCTNEQCVKDKSFRFENFQPDWSGAMVDLLAGLGGFCYFVGSIYFHPIIDINTHITHIGAVWFQLGGLSYFLSGLFMTIRYFYVGKFDFVWDKPIF